MNKKGITTIGLFAFFFIALIVVLFLGIFLYIFNVITTNLAIDVDLGAVNLKDTVDSTLGQINTGFLNNADIIGVSILFGMVLSMLVSAFFLRGKYPRLMMIVDIIILVICFAMAVYISWAYEIIITSSSELSIYGDYLPNSSRFILNLPSIVGIIGAIIMIVSYSNIPKEKENVDFLYQ